MWLLIGAIAKRRAVRAEERSQGIHDRKFCPRSTKRGNEELLRKREDSLRLSVGQNKVPENVE